MEVYGYATSAIRFYTDSKQVASQKIDSMNEVLNASPAAFELIRSIVRRTHTAILDGENMENIRFITPEKWMNTSGNMHGITNSINNKARKGTTPLPCHFSCLIDHAGNPRRFGFLHQAA